MKEFRNIAALTGESLTIPVRRARTAQNFSPLLLDAMQAIASQNPSIAGAIDALAGQVHAGKTFATGFAELSQAEQAAIQAKIGSRNFSEILSLSHESDAQVFFHGLAAFASARKNDSDYELAASVFGWLAHTSAGEVPQQVRERALAQFNAITGKGPMGPRLGVLVDRGLEESIHPKVIGPMMVASVFGGGVAAFSLARLLRGGGAIVSSGTAARVAAGLVGYTAEFSSFAVLSHALHAKPGASLQDDLYRAAITIGALRGAGSLGNQAFLKLHGLQEFGAATRLSAWLRFNQVVIPSLSQFNGMLLATGIETRLGLREPTDSATAVVETLATMFSLGIGIHLAHRSLGRGFAGLQTELKLRANIFDPGSGRWRDLLGPQAWASPEGIEFPSHLMSATNEPPDGFGGKLAVSWPQKNRSAGTAGTEGGEAPTPVDKKWLQAQVNGYLRKFRSEKYLDREEGPKKFAELIAQPELTLSQRKRLVLALLGKLAETGFVSAYYFALEGMALHAMEKGGLNAELSTALWRGLIESSPHLEKIGSQFDHPDLNPIERKRLLNEISRRIERLPPEETDVHPNAVYKFDGPQESLNDILHVVGAIFDSKNLNQAQRRVLYQQVSQRLHLQQAVEVAGIILRSPNITTSERDTLYRKLVQRVPFESTRYYNHIYHVEKVFAVLADLFETNLLPAAEHRGVYENLPRVQRHSQNAQEKQLDVMTRLGWASVLLRSPYLDAGEKAGFINFIRTSMASPSFEIRGRAYEFVKGVKGPADREVLVSDLLKRLRFPVGFLRMDEVSYVGHVLSEYVLKAEEQSEILKLIQDENGLLEGRGDGTNITYNPLGIIRLERLTSAARELLFNIPLKAMADFRVRADPPKWTEADECRWIKRLNALELVYQYIADPRLSPEERARLVNGVIGMVATHPEAISIFSDRHYSSILKDPKIEHGQAGELWALINPLRRHQDKYIRETAVKIGLEIKDAPFFISASKAKKGTRP